MERGEDTTADGQHSLGCGALECRECEMTEYSRVISYLIIPSHEDVVLDHPVLPKPPAPLTLSSNSSTTIISGVYIWILGIV